MSRLEEYELVVLGSGRGRFRVAITANLPFTALRDAILTPPTMSEGLAALFRATPARS
jgi:hypothetical protein